MESKEDLVDALLTAQSGTWRGSWMEKLRPRYAAIIQSDRKAVAALFVPVLREQLILSENEPLNLVGLRIREMAREAMATAEREGLL